MLERETYRISSEQTLSVGFPGFNRSLSGFAKIKVPLASYLFIYVRASNTCI